ncbi:hypothetical protein BDV10DRAFT_156673 [Aspergillus recurvatus]
MILLLLLSSLRLVGGCSACTQHLFLQRFFVSSLVALFAGPCCTNSFQPPLVLCPRLFIRPVPAEAGSIILPVRRILLSLSGEQV